MSVKIRQRFRVTHGIGVEDEQHCAREREEIDNDEMTTMVVAGG
jgi:hypothetical protein